MTYQKIQELNRVITDQDIVEMGGIGAYLTTEESHKSGPLLVDNSFYPINGKNFKIGDIHNDSATGVNYSTWTLVDGTGDPIEPIQTVFVVQGSNALPPSKERDAVDDANLSSGITPEQYQLTLDEFNRINLEREKVGLPRITDVTGNSLGGGVANYIGYHTDGVNIVSLNPATVPNPPEGQNDDVISVISTDDVLNMLQSGVGYAKSGVQYTANGFGWGTKSLEGKSLAEIMTVAVTYGHTGYDEDRTGLGYQLDNLGLSTSLLTGNLLVEKVSAGDNLPVYIDANAIRNLISSLQTKGNNQLETIRQGLENVNTTAVTENADLDKRSKELIDYFNNYINTALHGWGWLLIDTSDDKLKELNWMVDDVGAFLRKIRFFLQPLTYLEKGLSLASHIPLIGNIFKEIASCVKKVNESITYMEAIPSNIIFTYSALVNLKSTITRDVPELFKSAHAGNNDGIPIAIRDYSNVLKDVNYPLIKAQYNNFLLTAVGIANSLEAMDEGLSSNLQNLNVVQTDTTELEKKLDAALSTPEAIQAAKILSEKEIQLNKNFETFNENIAQNIKILSETIGELVKGIKALLEVCEGILQLLRNIVRLIELCWTKEKEALDVLGLGFILEPLATFASDVRGTFQSGVDALDSLANSDDLRNATHICEDLSSGTAAYNLIQNVKPVVNLAIFSDSSMITVQTSAKAAQSLSRTLQQEFSALMEEISEESLVQGIRDLKEGSWNMSRNFAKLESHLDVLAF